MRLRVMAIALVFIALSFCLTGCIGEYFFSFKEEGSTTNKEGAWILENAGGTIQANGLNIQDSNLACPKRFSGDFTMTIVFRFRANGTDHKYNFGFALSDYTFYSAPANDIEIEFFGMGGPSSTYTIYESSSGSAPVSHAIAPAIPEYYIDGNHINVMKIVKTGDTIRLYEGDGNTEYLWNEFELGVYDSRWFGLNIFAYNISPADDSWGLTVESVRVEYDGNISDFKVNI